MDSNTAKTSTITGAIAKTDLFGLIEKAKTDSDVAFELGMMFLQGKEVPQNTNKAISYLEQAGKLGHPIAYSTLGFLYMYGNSNLEQDPWKATGFFIDDWQFFDNEDSLWEAYNLFRYGGKSNEPLYIYSALSLLYELSKRKSPDALYLTGEIYHKGLYGEDIDLEVAYSFYQEAADLGCEEAEEVLNLKPSDSIRHCK